MEKVKEEVPENVKSILALIPREKKLQFERKFLFFKYKKTYTFRPYSFRDKIYFMDKYGDEDYLRRLVNPEHRDFELVHFEILFQLLSDRDKKDFGNFEGFLTTITSAGRELELLVAALELRGLATSPKMTKEEMAEAESLKKKANLMKSTGDTASGNSPSATGGTITRL
jgi:hypothetical protein